MLNSYNTASMLSYQPLTFNPDTDIFEAIHLLLQHKASGATVLNDEKEVVGVISELDCLKAILNSSYYSQTVSATVGEFMTAAPIDHMVDDISIVDAAEAFIKTGRRRMPVIKDGKFAGQISARSVLQAFKDAVMEHDASED